MEGTEKDKRERENRLEDGFMKQFIEDGFIDKAEEETVGKLRGSLDFLDSNLQVRTPDLSSFRQMVAKVESQKQAKRDRQFLVFLLSAILMACAEVFLFSTSIIIFVVVQAVALMAILPASLWIHRSRKEQMESQ